MTTEDDFQRALDANPEDWQIRLVFADWLQDQGDPRAEGYRALGSLRRAPTWSASSTAAGWYYARSTGYAVLPHMLPPWWVWTVAMQGVAASRAAAEDAAALAFARLTSERRDELLEGVTA